MPLAAPPRRYSPVAYRRRVLPRVLVAVLSFFGVIGLLLLMASIARHDATLLYLAVTRAVGVAGTGAAMALQRSGKDVPAARVLLGTWIVAAVSGALVGAFALALAGLPVTLGVAVALASLFDEGRSRAWSAASVLAWVLVSLSWLARGADELQAVYPWPGAVVLVPAALLALLGLLSAEVVRYRSHAVAEIEGTRRDLEEAYGSLVEQQEQRERALQLAQAARAEAEAAGHASQQKSRFLAHMSHELRTPLNAIIGYSELASEELEDEGVSVGVAEVVRVQQSGRYLLALINDILDLSKIEADKLALDCVPVHLRRLADEVAQEVAPAFGKRGNRLRVHVDVEGPRGGDPLRLRQILLNLLSNANKFTDQGVVTLRIRSTADGVTIDVADTGTGMTAAQASRVFAPFIQAEASTARLRGGTGLGLAITEGLVRQMDGGIHVTSALGEGTTFTVQLPLPPRCAAASSMEPAAARVQGAC